MGIRYIRTSMELLGSPSSRSVIASTAVTLVTMNSGYQMLHIYNLGSNNLLWGSSGINIDSANVLFPAMFKTWESVEDGFEVYIMAQSAATSIVITEYKV